jgi:hypothetical protein
MTALTYQLTRWFNIISTALVTYNYKHIKQTKPKLEMSGLGQYNGKPQFVNFTEQLCQNRGKVYK